MSRESIGEPLSTLEMGAQLPDLVGVRAHHGTRTKPDAKNYVDSRGMFMGRSFSTEKEAKADRKRIANLQPTLGMKREYFVNTEIAPLKENQEYELYINQKFVRKLTHGKNDDTTHLA